MTIKSKYGPDESRMNEYIATLSFGLNDDDGVGFGDIIDQVRKYFGLEGPTLVDFVRRCLYTLVAKGATPRHWGPTRNYPLHFGNNSPSEIVEGVIADWLKSGGADVEWGDYRFMLSKYHERHNRYRTDKGRSA
jgi:hypothetical protein